MYTIALVPARKGSQGVPGKNWAELGGKPLVQWTIESALVSPSINEIVVSTDAPEVIEIAERLGVPVNLRKTRLARSETTTKELVVDFLGGYSGQEFVLILLQPTSPFRTHADIEAALQLLHPGHSVVSVTLTQTPPEWIYRTAVSGLLEPVLQQQVSRRQEAQTAYRLNGAIYCGYADDLKGHGDFLSLPKVPYVMPHSRSLDIDTQDDLDAARLWVRRGAELSHE